MRLNVYLQRAGIGSRREAERLVADGRVTVNGETAEATTPVADGDEVKVDGKRVAPEEAPVPRLFMLNKPLDYLTTTYDSQGRAIVYELPCFDPRNHRKPIPRLMNVGRLDVNSEGLLLFSSDGPLAQAMMSPATALKRIYRVRVHGRLTTEQIARLSRGVTANGVTYRGATVIEEKAPTGKNTWYQVVLTEGKNREIRKLMEHFGCVVNRLIRTDYGPFHLGDLKTGQLREIPPHEVKNLIKDLKARGAKL
jgi:23S rRNA pseudouridine2605 synthase